MWGIISPNWDLLQQHVKALGSGYYTVADREEWLFNNRSNRPRDDLKDEVCENTATEATEAWQFWTAQKNRFAQLRQPGPALVFPAETEVLDRFFQQVCREEELLPLCYKGAGQEVRARGTKKKKAGRRDTRVATLS